MKDFIPNLRDERDILRCERDALREENARLLAEILLLLRERYALRPDALRYRRLRQESIWIERDIIDAPLGPIPVVRSTEKLDARVDELLRECDDA